MTMNVVEEIRADLEKIRVFSSRFFPFIVIPLVRVRIVATASVKTASVNARGTLKINPEYWRRLRFIEKCFTAIHELLHLALCHPFRAKGFDLEMYNVAADAKINDAVFECPPFSFTWKDEFPLRDRVITLNHLTEVLGIKLDELRRMSTEEIARLLERKRDKLRLAIQMDIDLNEDEGGGEVVQEGDKGIYKDENVEEAWRKIARVAKEFAKMAGNLPADVERIVDEVLEVKPPWHVVLRFGLRNHEREDASFAYPSRRGDEYPGHYGYRYSLWCLIDTSGSISEKELKVFLGIVKSEARRATVYVLPWDAEAYEVIRTESPDDVARRVARKMKGGGGTVIAPALQVVMKRMQHGDAVIVLTDGYIYDENKEEVQRLFKAIASRASFAAIGYTGKKVEAPGFTSFFVDLKSLS